MNICVYGAASNSVAEEFIKLTEDLGEEIARRSHTLVFGGGAHGMMGAVARGAHKKEGEIIGIAPKFFNADGTFSEYITSFISCDTMRERKKLLDDSADAFIITPGGIGTYDEFFEILTLRTLGMHTKPIAVYNIMGYFDELIALLDKGIAGSFMKQSVKDLIGFYSSPIEILDFVESYKGEVMQAFDAKSVDKEQ